MDERPYTADEQRVVDYLKEIIPQVGAGADPIGFLIASHSTLRQQRAELATEIFNMQQTICKLQGD